MVVRLYPHNPFGSLGEKKGCYLWLPPSQTLKDHNFSCSKLSSRFSFGLSQFPSFHGKHGIVYGVHTQRVRVRANNTKLRAQTQWSGRQVLINTIKNSNFNSVAVLQ